MADIKATSFRINEEDLAKFKEFAEKEGYNQAEAFKSILNTLEMATAKNLIKNRAKEVETFQDTINRLMGYYLNSLEVNQNSEERIRDEVTLELTTKDRTISNLQEQLEKIKLSNSEFEKNLKEKSIILHKAEEAILDWSKNTDKLKKDIEDKQKTIDILNKSNVNQLEQLEQYKDLKSTNDLLLKQLEELESKTLSLENTNKQLSDKVSNTEDMINFYKDNISDLKRDLEAYKEDIKDLDIKHSKYIDELGTKHNKQLEDIKVDYEKSLEKEKANSEQYREDLNKLDEKHQNQIKEIKSEYESISKKEIESIKDQLINKYDLQLEKKDLEIEKIRNELDQLKSKNTKVAKKVQDKE